VSGLDIVALAPLVVLSVTAVVVMLVIAVRRNHGLIAFLTLVGLAVAFFSCWRAAPLAPRQVTPLLIVDRFALFYTGLIILASFAVVLFSYGYLERHDVRREEFYVLLLTAVVGSVVLVTSDHFASFFLGLEILSVTLYAMIGYLTTRPISLEAGIKYLILAAASAAFLLFGMALIYAETGTMAFSGIARALGESPASEYGLILPGVALLITGIGFKLGVVPFHLWAPDVYEGAPAPVATFVATVSKGAVFAILLRYFYESQSAGLGSIGLIIAIIAVLSMLFGNLLALLQSNVKRILGYSSIAHLGYLLVAFLAGGIMGAAAATFYLVAYFVTTLGAFGVVTVLSRGERDADQIEDYRGLFWRRPVLGGVFTAMLLSLAGIPLTAGFLGKFYIVAAGAHESIWALIIILVVTSVIGLFYYLRIVVAMFGDVPVGVEAPAIVSRLSLAGGWTLAVLTVLLVWFGTYPSFILHAIQSAVRSLMA
jgi:NADH-quinone oxidoreductase subunit N